MEFVINKADLVRELQVVTGVVEKRATLPILANLLLEARDGGLQVGASDLEVTIRGKAPATIVESGSVTLPAAKLHEIARSLPDADVKFKLLDRHQMQITCKRTKYKIGGQPRDEFPSFPDVKTEDGISVPAAVLRTMIERVAFAITTDDPRYSLNGALVRVDSGRITLVATDGHRLAHATRELPAAKGEDLTLIVPRKALNEVSKMTADLEDDAEVVFGQHENHVFFVVGGHRLTSNVLEGKFPRYENVMPQDCKTDLSIPSEALSKAVRRVSLLASDRYGRAVQFELSEGTLKLESKTDVGEAEELLEVSYEGDPITIGFNARYVLDFLGVVGSEAVRLRLNPTKPGDKGAAAPGDKPGMFTPDGADDGIEYSYVVMPMHL